MKLEITSSVFLHCLDTLASWWSFTKQRILFIRFNGRVTLVEIP